MLTQVCHPDTTFSCVLKLSSTLLSLSYVHTNLARRKQRSHGQIYSDCREAASQDPKNGSVCSHPEAKQTGSCQQLSANVAFKSAALVATYRGVTFILLFPVSDFSTSSLIGHRSKFTLHKYCTVQYTLLIYNLKGFIFGAVRSHLCEPC